MKINIIWNNYANIKSKKEKDKNPIPRVPPVTRAVIPVRDHLCPPLLCASTAILRNHSLFLLCLYLLVNAHFAHPNRQIQLLLN
jgi:hypothetical protein